MVDEINPSIVEKVPKSRTDLSVEISQESNFHWGVKKEEETELEAAETKKELKDLLVLKNLNLKIKRGEFVCIIGDVGSGKSSLLMSLVGELLHASPNFAKECAQHPEWTTE